jgi:hypothetical protein
MVEASTMGVPIRAGGGVRLTAAGSNGLSDSRVRGVELAAEDDEARDCSPGGVTVGLNAGAEEVPQAAPEDDRRGEEERALPA